MAETAAGWLGSQQPAREAVRQTSNKMMCLAYLWDDYAEVT